MKCKTIINGKECGAEVIVRKFRNFDETKDIIQQLCKNPKCPKYYICSCGKKFGKH